MGPTWGRQDPVGPHVGHVNLAIWGSMIWVSYRPKSRQFDCLFGPTGVKTSKLQTNVRIYRPFSSHKTSNVENISTSWHHHGKSVTSMTFHRHAHGCIGSLSIRRCITFFRCYFKVTIIIMMKSSNGNIFRVTGHLCGNSPVTIRRCITSFRCYFKVTMKHIMMKSSNGNIFRVTGHLCGNSPVTVEFHAQRPVMGGFDVSLICAWINGWLNKLEASNLIRHRAQYDVIVLLAQFLYNCTRIDNNNLATSFELMAWWRQALSESSLTNISVVICRH